ncbi:MAG: hypothetical protein K2N22_00535 [Clostridia bacterium]|nr:hypothetical protein [Clostridia bacterium]
MIKSGIKNYFVNLKFYFVPIGAFAVGAIIGLSILLPGVLSAIKNFYITITGILNETSIDFTVVKDYIINSVKGLDWNSGLLASVKTLLSRDWLISLFNGCIDLIAADLQPYAQQIDTAVNTAVGNVTSLLGIFILFAILGLVGGYFLTAYLVRRNIAKGKIRKSLIAILIDSVIAPVLLFLCIWLFTLWKPSIIFSSLVSVLIFSITSLLSAYLVHGVKTVRGKELLSGSGILKLFASDIIIYYISVAIVLILSLVINVFSGILIGFSFIEIAFLVISINAESYVKNLIPDKSEEQEELLAA